MNKLKTRITMVNPHNANGIIVNKVIEEDNAILLNYCNVTTEEGADQYSVIYTNSFLKLDENPANLTESELLYVRMPILETELNNLTVSKLDDFIAQIELTDETNIVVPSPRLKEDKIQAILDFEGII